MQYRYLAQFLTQCSGKTNNIKIMPMGKIIVNTNKTHHLELTLIQRSDNIRGKIMASLDLNKIMASLDLNKIMANLDLNKINLQVLAINLQVSAINLQVPAMLTRLLFLSQMHLRVSMFMKTKAKMSQEFRLPQPHP